MTTQIPVRCVRVSPEDPEIILEAGSCRYVCQRAVWLPPSDTLAAAAAGRHQLAVRAPSAAELQEVFGQQGVTDNNINSGFHHFIVKSDFFHHHRERIHDYSLLQRLMMRKVNKVTNTNVRHQAYRWRNTESHMTG